MVRSVAITINSIEREDARGAVVQLDAVHQHVFLLRRQFAEHTHRVFAQNFIARMHKTVRQFAVRREQQQAFRVVVQTPHRDPLAVIGFRQAIKHSVPLLRVVAAHDFASLLVINQDARLIVTELHIYAATIDVHAILFIHDLADHGLHAVDLHFARFNHRFHIATRPKALLREHFMQTLAIAFAQLIHTGNNEVFRRFNRVAGFVDKRLPVSLWLWHAITRALPDANRWRAFVALIALIAIAPCRTIHRSPWVAKRTGVGFVVQHPVGDDCRFRAVAGVFRANFKLHRKRTIDVHHTWWTLIAWSTLLARLALVTRRTGLSRWTRFAWRTWFIWNRLSIRAEAHGALATGVAFSAHRAIATLVAATATTTIAITVATIAGAALTAVVGGRVVTDVFSARCVRHHRRGALRSFECRS